MIDTKSPEVTVVVPCYNHARYLGPCLDSIHAQTYGNFYIIVVDDGSHEQLRPSVRVAEQSRVRLIRHESNLGPAAARNTGIRESTTELFVCIDADDWLDPEFLSQLVSLIWDDETLDCVYSDVRLFGAENWVAKYPVPTLEDILYRQAIPGAGTMMRRRLWERVGGYDECEILRRGREDWEYYIRAFSSGCKAGRVAKPLYNYRISNKSLNITCRLHDAEVAEYIYDKHRTLFESSVKSKQFLSFGYQKAARAWHNQGFRVKAIKLAFTAWRLVPSNAHLSLLASVTLPQRLTSWIRQGRLHRFVPFFHYPLRGKERYRPFFIIGSGRSGSTLLRRILTAHSELHIPPENFELGNSIRKYRQFGGQMAWPDLVRFVMSLFEFHHEFYTYEVSLRALVNRLHNLPPNRKNLAYLLDALYRYHAEQHGCSMVRWGDKTPLITYETGTLELLLKVFPDAQFIHLVRDGCDVVASSLRYGFFTNLTSAAERWVRVVKNARQFTEAHAAQSLLVRYEDLVRRPQQTVRSICEYLEVDFDPQMLDSEDLADNLGDVPVLIEHKAVTEPINTTNIGTGRRDFSIEDRRQLEMIIGSEQRRFWYSSTINGDDHFA